MFMAPECDFGARTFDTNCTLLAYYLCISCHLDKLDLRIVFCNNYVASYLGNKIRDIDYSEYLSDILNDSKINKYIYIITNKNRSLYNINFLFRQTLLL